MVISNPAPRLIGVRPSCVARSSSSENGSGSITLARGDNDFGGAVTLTGSNLWLADGNDLTIASLTTPGGMVWLEAGGTLSLPAAAIDTGRHDLGLFSRGGALATGGALSGSNVSLWGADGISLGHDLTASGDLVLESTDAAILQLAGVVRAGGESRIDAGTGQVALDEDGNDFGGAVHVTDLTNAAVTGLVIGLLAVANSGYVSIQPHPWLRPVLDPLTARRNQRSLRNLSDLLEEGESHRPGPGCGHQGPPGDAQGDLLATLRAERVEGPGRGAHHVGLLVGVRRLPALGSQLVVGDDPRVDRPRQDLRRGLGQAEPPPPAGQSPPAPGRTACRLRQCRCGGWRRSGRPPGCRRPQRPSA